MALYPRLPKTVPQAWLSSGAFTLLALTLWLPVHAFTESGLFIKNPLFQLWILLFMFLVYLVAQIGITHNILRRIATSLGNLSYAVYLVHPFVWFNLDKTGLVLTENPLLFALTAFTLSTIAAQLLFKYIETPSREYGRKIAAGLRPAVSDQPSARQP
jgi:peptidoglycan/LPS O-acetylase OafA/YrhL